MFSFERNRLLLDIEIGILSRTAFDLIRIRGANLGDLILYKWMELELVSHQYPEHMKWLLIKRNGERVFEISRSNPTDQWELVHYVVDGSWREALYRCSDMVASDFQGQLRVSESEVAGCGARQTSLGPDPHPSVLILETSSIDSISGDTGLPARAAGQGSGRP